MKKLGLFLGGVATGVVATFIVLFIIAKATNSETPDGVTNFENVGDVIDESSVKVFQVVGENAALVNGQDATDKKYGWYHGTIYLIRNYEGKMYYDEEIIKKPSGKQFRQTGIYQYNTKIGYKTVPIIEIR